MSDEGAIVALDPETFGRDQPCFGCSPSHPTGLRLKFERRGEVVCTRFTPGERHQGHQGPPGLLHGGLAMTLADELAAWTVVGLKQRLGFTAAFEGRLRKPIRIGVPVDGRGEMLRDAGRVLKIGVTLEQESQHVFEGQFTFALLDQSGVERMLGGSLPEAWKRFCRTP
jgi:acyl-coenzyme A thioesterase PaaI-like protein